MPSRREVLYAWDMYVDAWRKLVRAMRDGNPAAYVRWSYLAFFRWREVQELLRQRFEDEWWGCEG